MGFDQRYNQFVASQKHATLWHDPNFLSCFGTDSSISSWSYAKLEMEGDLIAVLPYYHKKRIDGWAIVMPPPLRYCEPLIDYKKFKTHRKGELIEACSELLAQLPKGYRSAEQFWSPNLTFDLMQNWMVTNVDVNQELKLFKFDTDARPTYLVDISGDQSTLRSRANKTMRRRLRKAETYWTLKTGKLTSEVFEILASPFTARQQAPPYKESELSKMFDHFEKIGKAVSHQAIAPDGRVLAASLALCDDHSIYCLLSGSHVDAKKYDGGSFVLAADLSWGQKKGIKQADFLGSSLPGPAENRRQLGGIRQAYMQVYHDAAWWTKLKRQMG